MLHGYTHQKLTVTPALTERPCPGTGVKGEKRECHLLAKIGGNHPQESLLRQFACRFTTSDPPEEIGAQVKNVIYIQTGDKFVVTHETRFLEFFAR